MKSRLKLWSWIMRMVAMTKSISGTTALIGPCALPLSSTAPPMTTE